MTILYRALPYSPDSCAYLDRLLHLDRVMVFDSGQPGGEQGRFDIFTACPDVWLEYQADGMARLNGETIFPSETALGDLLRLLGTSKSDLSEDNAGELSHLPFTTGLAGLVDYDFATLPPLSKAVVLRAGRYNWSIVTDHREKTRVLIWQETRNGWIQETLLPLLTPPSKATTDRGSKTFTLTSTFQADTTWEQYGSAFTRIKEYLVAGDCYQVNLCQRFSAHYRGDPWLAFTALRTLAPAPFAGYVEWPGFALSCHSPERFLAVQGQAVETKPIKGTRKRHIDPQRDVEEANTLLNSTKDRAENVMIVDLLRNDLGQCCQPGSVTVSKLCALETFSNVHHLVSTVNGQLQPEHDALSLLTLSFPGGSITGAPKIRARQIIAELEPYPRRSYCGTLFYQSDHGHFDSNITIRSLVFEAGTVFCWGGGGIVMDSEVDREYMESITKIERLLRGLEERFF